MNNSQEFSQEPIAMQIIVKDSKDFTELELCLAVAHAIALYTGSVRLQGAVPAYYSQWSAGEHRKVVRRARGALWDKLLSESSDYFHYTRLGRKPELIIVPPTPISGISKNVKKAQVSGLSTLPNNISYITDAEPMLTIYFDNEVEMSSGKRAAAVAHISQLMTQKLDNEDFGEWMMNSCQIRVSGLGNMDSNVELSSVFVADNGHTEVDAGTVTAMGVWSKNPPLSMENIAD